MKIFVIHTKANLCANTLTTKCGLLQIMPKLQRLLQNSILDNLSWVLKNLMSKMKSSLQLNGSNLNISCKLGLTAGTLLKNTTTEVKYLAINSVKRSL